MNTTTIKSSFDSGKWSEVNGLPAQDDIIHYLEYLLSSSPNECYTRRDLMDSVINEFGIPIPNVEANGPKSHTPAFYTRVTYLITDSVQGKRRAEKAFAKRIAFGVYQHITGDGVLKGKVLKRPPVSKRLVGQAVVSVKILKALNWEPERIMCELHQWDDAVIEAAIEQVFGVV